MPSFELDGTSWLRIVPVTSVHLDLWLWHTHQCADSITDPPPVHLAMEDPLQPRPLDVATLIHLVSTPSDFNYEFEPEDFDLLENIIATDPRLQKIVDSVQLYLLQKMSRQNLIPLDKANSKPSTISTDVELKHFDECTPTSNNKPDAMHLLDESAGSAVKMEQTAAALHQPSLAELVASDFTYSQPMMETLMTRELKSTIELQCAMPSTVNINVQYAVPNETKVLKSKAEEPCVQHLQLSSNSPNVDNVCNQHVMDELPLRQLSSIEELVPVDSTENVESTTSEQREYYEAEVLKSKSGSLHIVHQHISLNSGAADSLCNKIAMGKRMSKEQNSVVKLFPVIPSTLEFWENCIDEQADPQGEEVLKMKDNDLPTKKKKVPANSKSAVSKSSQPVMEKPESRKLVSIEDVIIIDEDMIIADEDVIIIDPNPINIQKGTITETISQHEESLKSKSGDIATKRQQVELNGRAAASVCPQTKENQACEDVIHISELVSAIPTAKAIQGNYTDEPEAFHEETVWETKADDPFNQHQLIQLETEADNCIYIKHFMDKKTVAGDVGMNLQMTPCVDNCEKSKVVLAESHGKNRRKKKALKFKAEDHLGKSNQNRLDSRAVKSLSILPFTEMLEAREPGFPAEVFSPSPPPMGNSERNTFEDAAPTEQEVLILDGIQPTQCKKQSRNQVTFDPVKIQSGAQGKASKKVNGVPLSENPIGVDPGVCKSVSDTSASQKQKHSKSSKDTKVIKTLHKKQKEMAPASQQAPANLPSNSVFTLESDQNIDCQIVAVYEALSMVSSHGISSATKHTQNARKRQAVKDANIQSSMCGMHESRAKRAYKPMVLEGGSECIADDSLSSPEIVENINKKSKKRKNKWDEDIEIINVYQKYPSLEATTNRLPTLCKKHFLDANNESIPSKKPKNISTEPFSAINAFMKRGQLMPPAALCKWEVPAPSVKDPIINYFASLKVPKYPSMSKEFPCASHEKQVVTEHPAENRDLTMDLAGQGLLRRRMQQDIVPCSHFPKNVHGPYIRQLPSTFRPQRQGASYQTIFTQRPYEMEAPSAAFQGQGPVYGRLAEASMPAFPDNASSIKSSSSDSQ